MATLQFLGATETVTGSKFVLESRGSRAIGYIPQQKALPEDLTLRAMPHVSRAVGKPRSSQPAFEAGPTGRNTGRLLMKKHILGQVALVCLVVDRSLAFAWRLRPLIGLPKISTCLSRSASEAFANAFCMCSNESCSAFWMSALFVSEPS